MGQTQNFYSKHKASNKAGTPGTQTKAQTKAGKNKTSKTENKDTHTHTADPELKGGKQVPKTEN